MVSNRFICLSASFPVFLTRHSPCYVSVKKTNNLLDKQAKYVQTLMTGWVKKKDSPLDCPYAL